MHEFQTKKISQHRLATQSVQRNDRNSIIFFKIYILLIPPDAIVLLIDETI